MSHEVCPILNSLPHGILLASVITVISELGPAHVLPCHPAAHLSVLDGPLGFLHDEVMQHIRHGLAEHDGCSPDDVNLGVGEGQDEHMVCIGHSAASQSGQGK